MVCPVCGGSERKLVNVRVQHESDLKQMATSTWDGRNVARCNGCGVLYDHRYAEGEEASGNADQDTADPTNCPECGSILSDDGTCSYCGTVPESG